MEKKSILASGKAQRWKKIFIIVAIVMLPNLLIMWSTSAQSAVSTSNFGIGRGDGLEIGINLSNLNRVRADINAGVYDRSCTAAEHDPNKWHTLVNVEARCHFDHQHGDDPNYVNDLFGEPGVYFGQPGKSVSYPWQTFKAATTTESNAQYIANKQMENDLKHEGYTWVVRRDQQCPDTQGCTTDFRLQFHGIFGAHDAVVRWHSFSYEGRLCNNPKDPSTCGIFRLGGWIDFGRLFVTQPNVVECGQGVEESYIPLSADTLYFPLDRPEARDEVRCHPTLQNLPQLPVNYPLMEWWGLMRGRFRFQVRSYDPIGNIRQDAPDQWQFNCTLADINCRYDQTVTSAFIGYVTTIPEFVDYFQLGGIKTDRNGDGRTDFKGFTDRFGGIKGNCTQASLDCIPLEFNNIPMNTFNNKEAAYFHHPCSTCAHMDYDISPPGKKWNTWFFTKYAGGQNGQTPTPVPTQPTQPTAVPTGQPTAVPTQPPPTGAAIRVEVSPANAAVGQTVNIALKLYNVSNVYGIQAQCSVDAAILKGTTRTDGDGFNTNNSFFVDNGFKADGKWMIAASRIQPNTPISGNSTAFSLAYSVAGAGDGKLNCTALAVDQNGRDLKIQVINSTYVARQAVAAAVQPEVTQEVVVVPTEVPVVVPTEAPVVVVPDVPVVVPEVTAEVTTEAPLGTEIDSAAVDLARLSTISGIAQYQNRANNAGIKVELYRPDQTKVGEVVTGADGKFSFTGVAIGSYGLLITAPQHIPSLAPAVIDANGKVINAGTAILKAGDTDNNGKIDIVDATFIGANFGLQGASIPMNADLNKDTIINVSDLALVGGNYGAQSPLPAR